MKLLLSISILMIMIMAGCFRSSDSEVNLAGGTGGEYTLVETSDMKKLFDTKDETELALAGASLSQDMDESSVNTLYIDAVAYGKVLKCVRKIMESRAGGLEGTRKAADLLVGLGQAMYLGHGALELERDCKNYQQSSPKMRVDRNEQARFIAYSGYDARVKTMLYRFIKPTTTCYTLGGKLDAGLVGTAGADVGLEYCLANNGRHWIQLALEGRAGYGAGLLTLIRFGAYRYRMNHLGGPFTYTPTRSKSWVVGFGMGTDEYGEDYAHKSKHVILAIPRRGSKGMGIGLAYLRQWGARGGFKFLPLGTRGKSLISSFVNLSKGDLAREQATLASALRSENTHILKVDVSGDGADHQVKFTMCTNDRSTCNDLLGGRYFPLSLIRDNIERLQLAEDSVEDSLQEQRTRMLIAGGVAVATAGTLVVKRNMQRFSTASEVTEEVWDSHKQGSVVKAINQAERGVPSFTSPSLQSIWAPVQNFLQRLLDSHPAQAIAKFANKVVDSYNKTFVELDKGVKIIGKASPVLRVALPVAAVVGGGGIAFLSSFKVNGYEMTLQRFHKIEGQRDEIADLIQNPHSEIIVYDQRLMLETLRYLVSRR